VKYTLPLLFWHWEGSKCLGIRRPTPPASLDVAEDLELRKGPQNVFFSLRVFIRDKRVFTGFLEQSENAESRLSILGEVADVRHVRVQGHGQHQHVQDEEQPPVDQLVVGSLGQALTMVTFYKNKKDKSYCEQSHRLDGGGDGGHDQHGGQGDHDAVGEVVHVEEERHVAHAHQYERLHKHT
jgi:hypothetical protein